MFGSLGLPEILLILALALIVFGPKRLPHIGKSLGRAMAEFRRASNEIKRTLEEEVDLEEKKEKDESEDKPPAG